jgi:hypothetical protein
MTLQQEATHDLDVIQIGDETSIAQAKDDAWFLELIDEAISKEDWQRLFRRLARSKSARAKQLLVRYRFARIDPARRTEY